MDPRCKTPASMTWYAKQLVKVEKSVSRFNADTSGPDACRSEGKARPIPSMPAFPNAAFPKMPVVEPALEAVATSPLASLHLPSPASYPRPCHAARHHKGAPSERGTVPFQVMILATVHDTFAKPAQSDILWVSTKDLETAHKLKVAPPPTIHTATTPPPSTLPPSLALTLPLRWRSPSLVGSVICRLRASTRVCAGNERAHDYQSPMPMQTGPCTRSNASPVRPN